jgi:cell division inhibitor SepF
MSLGDVWHRTLVYFGIAEEYDDGWDEEYLSDDTPSGSASAAPVEPVYADRASTNVRRLPRRRESDHDYDDWTSGEARAAEVAPQRSGPRALPPADGAIAQVHLVVPRGFNDAKQIADRFKRSVPVIVNLQDADVELSKRLIDFSSGLTYAPANRRQGVPAHTAEHRGLGRRARQGARARRLLQPSVGTGATKSKFRPWATCTPA